MSTKGPELGSKKSSETPPSEASVSGQPSADRQSSSVFDFLYHDARRVGSFLSQFETYGVPSQTKATEASSTTGTTATSFGGDAKLPLLASAKGSFADTVATDLRESVERTFDPLWTNARRLLDYLTERDLIRRDLFDTRLGEFVLVQGTLMMLDLSVIKQTWDKPHIKSQFIKTFESVTGAQPANRSERRKNKPGPDHDLPRLMVDMISIFPHSLQIMCLGENAATWCTLAEASLVGTSSDIVLKHGSVIPGVWSILGILDAFPRLADETVEQADGTTKDYGDVIADIAGTMVGGMATRLGYLARNMVGMPVGAFGITPILIFRSVA